MSNNSIEPKYIVMYSNNYNKIIVSRDKLIQMMNHRKKYICDFYNVSNKELTRCCKFFNINHWKIRNNRNKKNKELYNMIEQLEQENNVQEFLSIINQDESLEIQ